MHAGDAVPCIAPHPRLAYTVTCHVCHRNAAKTAAYKARVAAVEEAERLRRLRQQTVGTSVSTLCLQTGKLPILSSKDGRWCGLEWHPARPWRYSDSGMVVGVLTFTVHHGCGPGGQAARRTVVTYFLFCPPAQRPPGNPRWGSVPRGGAAVMAQEVASWIEGYTA